MEYRIYESDNEYILDVLEDEEERLREELGGIVCSKIKYLLYRYISVRDTMENIKSKIKK
ncbi:hypothetical protein [Clostridium sp. C2-6-12]|uniref:hypothetical protein n=1 Tax=Clostridium sp. C2-6-12 TaxID=2698832 RepID=UPI00136A79F6|nr:hypothetical protein [Clostridium sp. C2-6-12]